MVIAAIASGWWQWSARSAEPLVRRRPAPAPRRNRLLQDLKVALLFLTRFPVQLDGAVTMRDLAGAVYAFPLVGAAVGLLAGLGFWARLGSACRPCPRADRRSPR